MSGPHISSHLRYGSLIYLQDVKDPRVKQRYEIMEKYKNIYYGSVKDLFRLHKSTPHRIIN